MVAPLTPFMDSPRYTVIIPMSRFRADEPVLVNLRETAPPAGGVQILVAEGRHPARQRNAALGQARGNILIFLDNDCSMSAGYWKELERAMARPEVEIVGGPALLRPQAAAWEEIFHALLTHTLIVGTVSARYAPRGEFRMATQTDLILCNLAVRRSIFEKIGRLSTNLYPNEENEWLDRAHAKGVNAYYDPDLQVFRPQRTTPGQMGLTLLRYGMGRTRQFRVSGWRPTFHQFLPFMLLATLVALARLHLEVEFVILWLVASAIIAFTCDGRLRGWQRIVAGLIAPLVPLTYAVGQTLGWFALFLPAPAASSEIVLLNERGERI
jgi:GT2 family glycosyltransferase